MGLAALGADRRGADAGRARARDPGGGRSPRRPRRDERVLVADLGSIAARVAAEGIAPPAVIVVGAIVALRDELLALARAGAPA